MKQEPNTFDPELHKPSQPKMCRPYYKALYEYQISVNKSLLIVIAGILLCGFGYGVGSHLKYKHDLSLLRRDLGTSYNMLDQYRKDEEYLLSQNASLSAQLDDFKLTDKAKVSMKYHPEVTKKIKDMWGSDWVTIVNLYSQESGLNPGAINSKSGACGIVQSLPCEKMNCSLDDVDCQLNWGVDYLINRYGSAQAAWNHEVMMGWY